MLRSNFFLSCLGTLVHLLLQIMLLMFGDDWLSFTKMTNFNFWVTCFFAFLTAFHNICSQILHFNMVTEVNAFVTVVVYNSSYFSMSLLQQYKLGSIDRFMLMSVRIPGSYVDNVIYENLFYVQRFEVRLVRLLNITV
jgi:hypothetical protein